jgi:hypothetical protein
MVGSCYNDPSDLVPGIVVVDHARKHHEMCGHGGGPDRALLDRSKVPGTKRKDLGVIFYFFGVLSVISTFTAPHSKIKKNTYLLIWLLRLHIIGAKKKKKTKYNDLQVPAHIGVPC